MSAVIKYGVGAIVLGAIVFSGNKISEKNRAEAIERYGLNESAVQTMDFCKSSMRSNNVEFTTGVDELQGCACIATEFSNEFDSKLLPVATGILSVSHKYATSSDVDDRKFEENLMSLQEDFNMTPAKFERTITTVLGSLQHCSKVESHMTEEQLAKAATDKAAKVENQIEAANYAVEKGYMTREEADRRIAKIRR